MATTTITLNDVRNLVSLVESLDGTIPAELTSILATADAVDAWNPTAPKDVGDAFARGVPIKDAAKTLDAGLLVRERPADVQAKARYGLATRAHNLVCGPAGDAIVANVKPAFDTACQRIAELGKLVAPSDTVEILETADDQTIAAWRELAGLRDTLDASRALVDALVLRFDAVAASAAGVQDIPMASYAAFYAADAEHLAPCGRALAPNAISARAGRWHTIAPVITLNTPSRAREILDEIAAQQAEHRAREYAATHGSLRP
ncbi:hypothetical protein [uncultured Gordonia sp.]|jgi:hypothetical protein|uniref:hypothetical protein n=1 Tax=uncultured Gordonia sp. TaxID=198437 RepID=UPI002618A08E|nr:hypothetical protein [uncultured Gordonia sp.]